MPAHGLDLQRFFAFVNGCILDPRFTPDNVIGKIQAAGGKPGPLDRYLLRTQVIPQARETALVLSARVAALLGENATRWGAGRVDTFNPYKAIQFNWRLEDLPPSELIGAADYPSLWNQKPREGMHLHWDGNNDSVDERNLSASLGAGVTPVTVDHPALKRVRDWIWTLPPPPYPFAIDAGAGRARRASLRHAVCELPCGSPVSRRRGRAELAGGPGGADRQDRDRSAPPELLHPAVCLQPVLAVSRIRPIASPIFARPTATPTSRWTGSGCAHRTSTMDPSRPCAICWSRRGPAPRSSFGAMTSTIRRRSDSGPMSPKRTGASYFRFDTSAPGNSNRGHEYGTTLPASDKDAIVEYMKRL